VTTIMTPQSPILFRADAGAQLGIGHLMRCLAIAQATKASGRTAIFLSDIQSPELRTRLQSEGFEMSRPYEQPGTPEDAKATTDLARQVGADWIVADGYRFMEPFQERIKAAGSKLLLVDDYGHAHRYFADIILNQNIDAPEDPYRHREMGSKLLIGSKYVLLRREFVEWRKREIQETGDAERLLITMGGGDSANVSLKVWDAIQSIRGRALECKFVIGAANSNRQVLEAAVEKNGHKTTLCFNPSCMPELMAWAQMALTAAGCTLWELCFMGVPALTLVIAPNQERVAKPLADRCIVSSLGLADDVTPSTIAKSVDSLLRDADRRNAMSSAGRSLIDGEGVERVLMHLDGRGLRLRKVRSSDCGILWTWANDPSVRSVSYNVDSIPWSSHVEWLNSKLVDPNVLFYVAVDQDDIPVGQLRYDIDGEVATVSISLDAQFRGRGYGPTILKLGSRLLFRSSRVSQVHAKIKPGNENSVHAFCSAGFESAEVTKDCEKQALHFFQKRGAVC